MQTSADSLLERAKDRFDPLRPLLHSLVPFEHQVAGHTKETLYRYKEYILKPLVKPALFMRELAVYEQLAEEKDANYFMFPKYFGAVEVVNEAGAKVQFIVMDDLTLVSSSSLPCVIDIKIGRQTYEPSVDEAKKQREKLKYIYQEEIGFRITGMKVFDSGAGEYIVTDKRFGRSLLPSQVADGLAIFFLDACTLRADILNAVIIKLSRILEWMTTQNKFQFYCSSILVVYGSARSSDSETPRVEVRMIDLAHTIPSDGAQDDGYIHGLSNLVRYLQQVLESAETTDGMRSQCARCRALLATYAEIVSSAPCTRLR